MARKFQIKRGPFAKIPTLAQAEFGMTTDSGSERLFLGNGTINLEIPFLKNLSAAKIGAVADIAVTTNDANIQLVAGGDKVFFNQYILTTKNTPYTEGATAFSIGFILTYSHSATYGSQLCIPAGSSDIFTRMIGGNGEISKWVRCATDDSAVSKKGDTVLGDLETTGKVKAHDVTLKSTGRLYASMSAYSPTKEFTVMLDDPDLGLYSCLIMSTDKLMYMDKSEYAKEVLHEGNIQRLLGVMSASVE